MPRSRPASVPRRVALALDDNMVYGLCVLISALKKTATKDFSLVIGYFEGRLTPAHEALIRQFLEELGVPHEIWKLTPSPLFTERRHLTITTFSKFVIADLLPEPHLWIDIDTIARAGWDDIFDAMHEAPSGVCLVVAEKRESPFTRFDGFNAGVLGWTGQPRKKWEAALQALPEKRFSSEQYLFNSLYADSVTQVGSQFNFLSSWHHQKEALSRACIIHYSGPIKPWHLARQHKERWKVINSSWDYWFQAEQAMLAVVVSPTLRRALARLRRQALFSGRLHVGKGALAGFVMRFLAVAGPLGTPVVTYLARRAAP